MTNRESANPLRPYYIPPSVGLPPDPLPSRGNNNGHSPGRLPAGRYQSSKPPSPSARAILSDLDYSGCLSDSSPSAAGLARTLLDQALWKYTSVLLAQPFEVAKTILQCQLIQAENIHPYVTTNSTEAPISADENIQSDDSESEESAYFTSARVPTRDSVRQVSRNQVENQASRQPARPSSITTAASSHPYRLELHRPNSLLDVISQLWRKEGAWGVWKGANTTFLYSVLLKTVESWSRSLLAALLNAPDPALLPRVGVGGVDVAESAQPWMSLGIAVAAAGIAGILLAPLDLIRTRLILKSTSSPSRSISATFQQLSSLTWLPSLLPITLLHSTLPTFISSSAPILLRSRFGIDPVLSPARYSIFTFISATTELFLRLPLETVLRRGQAHVALASPSTDTGTDPGKNDSGQHLRPYTSVPTVVDIAPYQGIIRTMWNIVREESSTTTPSSSSSSSSAPADRVNAAQLDHRPRRRKGQGFQGLWKGWRVGMWGLIGMWGAHAFGAAGGGGGSTGLSEF